ncbi:MAG: hypothetical protein ACI9ZH_002428 [Paracoccaceae bacterium]|jgi:hypothetical protein
MSGRDDAPTDFNMAASAFKSIREHRSLARHAVAA